MLDRVPAEPFEHSIPLHPNCTMENRPVGGEELSHYTTSKILWMCVTSQGKNIYGNMDSPKNIILAGLGVDDMQTANRYLMDIVQDVQEHGYNPEPLWNTMMASAREQLQPLMETLATTRQCIVDSQQLNHTPQSMDGPNSPYKVQTIDNVANFFNVALPELKPDQKLLAQKIANGLAAIPSR